MRQIKFRGKSADGKWHYGDLRQFGRQDKDLKGKVGIYPDNDDDWRGCPIVDENTIGQFTGLTDRNGKEIYEGDMLECPQVPNVPLEVYYNTSKGAFCLAEHTHTEGILKGTTPIGDMLDYYPDILIIGNIHDNKIKEKWNNL